MKTFSRTRGAMLASVALAIPTGVAAQVADAPIASVETPHANGAAVVDTRPIGSVETPSITINNNFTPAQAQDPTNITGVGQIITDAGGGSIGTCTGTLINRRTVLFAAHCVNGAPATSYGANTGGTAIGVGFEQNTRANAAGQPDELVQWLLAGPNQYRTNVAQSFYNIRQLFWNPASVSPSSCTTPTSCFLESDVALGVLDTPANNLPTWAMLFSPLNAPATIDPANGTGYHVTVTGYGRNGTGTTGASGSDFRRRVAENMLGALTSLDDRNQFLFGSGTGNPQVLYFLDFDDPNRANPRDFNGFRDNALPREGSTGPGDSGGPLILDQAYAKKLVIGVLSGGSTFFTGQPGGSYGTQSFYQPLFLTWDWIAANNPYRYVSAAAGTRNWEDAATWRTDLDPNYNILVGNTLTNGVPTNPGGGPTATTPKFGEYCFQFGGANECQDIATGRTRIGVPNTRATGEESLPGREQLVVGGDTSSPAREGIGGAVDTATAAAPGYADRALPAPTLANGLPGATGFVPNNADGNRTAGIGARYFDVTLREAGTLNLGSAVTIDNMTVRGASSRLNVAAAGSLTSLFEFNQLTGVVQNDGAIRSVGDYLLMSGLLTGSGRITAPFLTSVMGSIAPGTMGTIGTLTVAGNLVLSSGSNLLIDIGGGSASDQLAVVAGAASGSGIANVGGAVTFSPTTGSTVRFGDTYTFLTATGGIGGRFNATNTLSAILRPELVYSANAVRARIAAGRYADVVAATPVQTAYARLLDNNRTNYAALAGLYGTLDLQNAATIRSTLESWAPRTEALARSMATVAVDNINRLYRGRIGAMSVDDTTAFDGSVAMIGQPLQFAQQNPGMGMPGTAMTASDANTGMIAPRQLPQGTRGFVAGGYLDGRGRAMQTAIPAGNRDRFDGWYAAAGVEAHVADRAGIGFGLSYSKLNGDTAAIPQSARGELVQGTLYGKTQSENGLTLDALFSAGWLGIETNRAASLVGSNVTLRSKDDTLALSTEVGVATLFGDQVQFGPRVAFRASNIGFSKTIETGGPMALFLDRQEQGSAQGLAGLTINGGTARIRPYVSGYYVHEFLDKPAFVGANFVGGIGPNSLFALNGTDRNWAEAAAGVTLDTGRFSISVGADTTIWRKDVSNQAYRGSIAFRF